MACLTSWSPTRSQRSARASCGTWATDTFGPLEPYRASTGLSAIDTSSGSAQVTSLEATSGVAAAPLIPGGPIDLVTANPGSNTLGVLAGLGGGLFANPVAIQIASNPRRSSAWPTSMATGSPTSCSWARQASPSCWATARVVFTAGHAGRTKEYYDVGPEPTGLTIADINRDGIPDLLVSNAYGDLIVLQGNGDGTFQSYHTADQAITLAVADLTGNGSKDIIYADQGLDQVTVQYGAKADLRHGRPGPGLARPGAVVLDDLNGNGIQDLIVANSGSNNVLIYPGLGNGRFGPAINGGHGYFVGTNPVGITVAYLTGALPDLVVADKGSNQVTILLNQSQGGNIAFGGAAAEFRRDRTGLHGRRQIHPAAPIRISWSATAGRTTSPCSRASAAGSSTTRIPRS